MRSLAHRPDARRSCAVLLYEGDVERPDAYRHRPGHEDDPYERERRERERYEQERRERDPYERERRERERYEQERRERDPYERERREREWYERERYERERYNQLGGDRRSSSSPPRPAPSPPPPPATLAVRDSLTRWPDSLFRTEPGRVVALDITFPDSSYRLHEAVRGTSDLLLVHYTGVLDVSDPHDRPPGRSGGLSFAPLFDLVGLTRARHIVVVLESDRPDQVPPVAVFSRRYEELMWHFRGRLTLIVTNPDRWSPRPFLTDALAAEAPLSARTLAAHPRARVLMRANGRDVRLSGPARRGGREPLPGHRARDHALAVTRSSLTKARESTASALSAAALPALLLMAFAVITVGLYALLRALPPMRGTWGAAALLGLWAVLVVIGIVGARLRRPPARARPPGAASTSSPAPRRRAFMDGVWAAWGFSGPLTDRPLTDTAGRPRQPAPDPPRPTREEARATVERSLNALYARLPVPQLQAPAPPAPPPPPSSSHWPSHSPDNNGTTP
ncbi:hypothetical protein ACFVXC_20620 [Streptomyces sp. NPDC058257]|uniref:hypothetical protein n=1 Tax=Streptomyces sp. NPDC058257 TaxID=3346409 RepID=UPI0036E40BCD